MPRSLRETAHRLCIALLCVILGAGQVFAGSMTLLGAGGPAVAAAYQGVADAVGVTPTEYYSCSRAVSAAKASTSTSLCDLFASGSTTTAVGTLRASATGFADQSAYFAGSVTPAAACAAATGGSCVVGRRYNQITPGTLDQTATTTGMPVLTFSAQNGLPGITCSGSNALVTGNATIAQPLTLAGVAKRSAGINVGGIIGSNAGTAIIGITGGTASSTWQALDPTGTNIQVAAADGSFHSGIGVFNGASPNSSISIDGTTTTGTLGTGGYVGTPIATCRAAGTTIPAVELEGMVFGVALTPTQISNLTANERSATNGYNF